MPEITARDCPERETLSDFLLGKLDPELSSACENHLASCEPCIETISGLDQSDTFQSLVVQSASSNEAVSDGDESVVGNLIHRMIDVGKQTRSDSKTVDQRAVDVVSILEPATSAHSIGQIEHYRIEEILGCGSTGVVFRAIDENLHRPVAIKVLRPTLGDAAKERFVAEARATATLDHPNIVTIFQVGQSGPLAFIVMQWLPGETLDQRLERDSILPAKTVKTFGQQIANGLAAAHQKGLVHRDIKPANLWITKDDQVKILDFGLVRIMDESPQLTCTGMIAGTPCYMSPEQSRGDELDSRSDLFSLGCVLYQCLTGKLPFTSSNALATLQAIQRVQPTSPANLDASTPADVSDLVMNLLEKSPHRRPDSASDVSDAFGSDRTAWPFECDHYCDLKPVKSRNKTDRTKPRIPTRSSSIWQSIALVLATGIIGWGAIMFGPQIIRIATDQGEIVIKSNDPDVQVEVLKGGESIEVVDLKTKQSIQIKSGNYQIRPVGEQNSISIDKETLTLSRGESAIVTVTKNEPLPSAIGSETKPETPLPTVTGPVTKLGTPLASPLMASARISSPVDPLHKVAPGDVLNVFVQDVLGNLEEGISGFPVHVRSNGTIALPLIDPIDVDGKTAIEIEDKLRSKYIGEIIREKSLISVTVHTAYTGKNRTLSEPVYNGMTFDQCFNAITYERDGAKLQKPIQGIIELRDAADVPELVAPLMSAVIRVRRYDSNNRASSHFVNWLTDKQLQNLAISISLSDSSEKWSFFRKYIIPEFKRVRPIHGELVTNIVDAIKKDKVSNTMPAATLIDLLQTKTLNAEQTQQSIKPTLDAIKIDYNALYYLSKMAAIDPAMQGLGEAIAEAIPRRNEHPIRDWTKLFQELRGKNKDAVVVALTKKALSANNVDNTLRTIAYLPDETFKLVEPELKNSKNENARAILKYRENNRTAKGY